MKYHKGHNGKRRKVARYLKMVMPIYEWESSSRAYDEICALSLKIHDLLDGVPKDDPVWATLKPMMDILSDLDNSCQRADALFEVYGSGYF